MSSIFLIFIPHLGKMNPIWRIFFRWGEKPPTSRSLSRDSGNFSSMCRRNFDKMKHPFLAKQHFFQPFCWLVASLWFVVSFFSPPSPMSEMRWFFFSPIHGTKNVATHFFRKAAAHDAAGSGGLSRNHSLANYLSEPLLSEETKPLNKRLWKAEIHCSETA